MLECPTCGSGLRFDIKLQKLLCEACDNTYNPHDVTRERDAWEQDNMETTVFVCPQCGGEVYSTDDSIAGFCSFCGSSTVMTSRIQKEKRPKYIIPFFITKEQCKESYEKMVKKAIYAPKEVKNPKYINEFRGIYMPYWFYDVEQVGTASIASTRSYTSGDYHYTEHLQANPYLDIEYENIPYDASSSFADDISTKLAPYNVRYLKEFSPSYLSGFYADTADVDSGVYNVDAKRIANDSTLQYLKNKAEQEIFLEQIPSDAFNTSVKDVDMGLLPVWFMSYKNGNRVTYATVNGQNGKVVADIPVDYKKYLLGCLIGIVPLDILLNLLFTFRPYMLLMLAVLMAVIAMFVYSAVTTELSNKETGRIDRGKKEARSLQKREEREKMKKAMEEKWKLQMEQEQKQKPKEHEPVEESPFGGLKLKGDVDTKPTHERRPSVSEPSSFGLDFDFEDNRYERMERNELRKELEKENKKRKNNDVLYIFLGAIFLIGLIFSFFLMMAEVPISLPFLNQNTVPMVVGLIGYIMVVRKGIDSLKAMKQAKKKLGFGIISLVMAVSTFAALLFILRPANDLFYYLAVILILVVIALSLVDTMISYNRLTTRELPQFQHRGGDHRA